MHTCSSSCMSTRHATTGSASAGTTTDGRNPPPAPDTLCRTRCKSSAAQAAPAEASSDSRTRFPSGQPGCNVPTTAPGPAAMNPSAMEDPPSSAGATAASATAADHSDVLDAHAGATASPNPAACVEAGAGAAVLATVPSLRSGAGLMSGGGRAQREVASLVVYMRVRWYAAARMPRAALRIGIQASRNGGT